MHICITGGCGFIGANCIERLLAEPAVSAITLYDNLSKVRDRYVEHIAKSRNARRKGAGYLFGDSAGAETSLTLVVGDILDKEAMKKAFSGVDAVIHLAAFTDVALSMTDPALCFEQNITGTVNVLEAARIAGVDRVVCASSNAAVGESDTPVDETVCPKPISPYGVAKLCGESLCRTYAASFNMNTTALRFANAYGLYSQHKTSVVAKMLKETLDKKGFAIYGDGNQTRDFIFAMDIAEAIRRIVTGGKKGFSLYQVATGTGTTIARLVELIKGITGADLPVAFEPARNGDIYHNSSNISRIFQEIGFSPATRIESGLQTTWEHFLQLPVNQFVTK